MQTIQEVQQAVKAVTAAKKAQNFAPLEQEARSHLETACAAFYLSRKSQTLRAWASTEAGPIRPIRINGRLAWAVADIKRLLNGGQ